MKRKQTVVVIVFLAILGFLIGGASWYILSGYAPKYTAQSLIRVLPAIDKDPMSIGMTVVDRDIQYDFRVSTATLVKRQSNLQTLVDRDRIQATKWFKSFGNIRDESTKKAVKDLEKNFGAYAQENGEFIVVSMTCGDKEESALIVNEMADLFLTSQGARKREEIATKLARLEEQRLRVQQDLNAAEDVSDEVRRRWGFADLEDHSYPHPVTSRLIRLEQERDNCALEIKELQADIENLGKQTEGTLSEQVKQERQANLKKAQESLTVLQGRLAELEKMRQEAAVKEKELNTARTQYKQRAGIRDERNRMLNTIKSKIEKLKIMHDDPEISKMQFVGYAAVPLEISSPRLGFYLPGGTILGFIFGMGLALLNRKTKNKKDNQGTT
jgi:uncharacterized protein involved in exopolysaccharide biosynthesis